MSYDLFFRHPAGASPDGDTLAGWFRGRRGWTVDRREARYEDPCTGVSFAFERTDHQDGVRVPLAFALPYLRPSFFAQEAAGELAAFVEAFDLEVFDPQRSGLGQGAFSAEGFLRGWRSGNLNALRARLAADPGAAATLKTLPGATLQAVWGWNRAREAYLERLGHVESSPCFAPVIFFVTPREAPTAVLTAVLWPEDAPTALPEVDLVLRTSAPGTPPQVVPRAALAPILERRERRPAGHRFGLNGVVHALPLAHHLIDEPLSPEEHERVWSLGAVRALVRCPSEVVLDRETVARAAGVGPAGSLRRAPQS